MICFQPCRRRVTRFYRLSLVWSICCWLSFPPPPPIFTSLPSQWNIKEGRKKKLPPRRQLEWGQSIGEMEDEATSMGRMGENWKGNDWSVLAPWAETNLVWVESGSISNKPSHSYISLFFSSSSFHSFPFEKKYKSRFQFSDFSAPFFVPSLGPYGTLHTTKSNVNSNRLRSAALHLPIFSLFFFIYICLLLGSIVCCSPVVTRLDLVDVTCVPTAPDFQIMMHCFTQMKCNGIYV